MILLQELFTFADPAYIYKRYSLALIPLIRYAFFNENYHV